MSDDDEIAARRHSVSEDGQRLRRKLDRIEADLTLAMEMLLRATGRRDLALDFLKSLGQPRPTLH